MAGHGIINSIQSLLLAKVDYACNECKVTTFCNLGITLSISGNNNEKFSHVIQIAAPWNSQ